MPELSGDSYVKLDREHPSPYIIESCLNRQILNHENSKLDSLNYSSCELLVQPSVLTVFQFSWETLRAMRAIATFSTKFFSGKQKPRALKIRMKASLSFFSSFFFLFPIVCNFYATDTA